MNIDEFEKEVKEIVYILESVNDEEGFMMNLSYSLKFKRAKELLQMIENKEIKECEDFYSKTGQSWVLDKEIEEKLNNCEKVLRGILE